MKLHFKLEFNKKGFNNKLHMLKYSLISEREYYKRCSPTVAKRTAKRIRKLEKELERREFKKL